MTAAAMEYTGSGRANRAALRDIKVRVSSDPTKFSPVDHLPQGTIKELLIWSHGSPSRMKRLLARELDSPTPRIKLIKRLYEKRQDHETRARAQR